MTIIVGISLVSLAAPARAQEGGYAGAFTRMGFGPRGMAMGNAMTSVEDEGIYAHYNPALAAGVINDQFDVSVAAMAFNRSLNAVNAAFKLPPNAGIDIGILNAGVGNIDGRSSSGYFTGYFSTEQYQFFADFGVKLSHKLQAGVGIKLTYANFSKAVPAALGTGFDLGLLFQPTKHLSIGFAAQDLLSYYRWDTQKLYGTSGSLETKDRFPTRLKLGASYRFFNNKLLVSTDFENRIEYASHLLTQVSNTFGTPQQYIVSHGVILNTQQLRFGAAYRIDNHITVRAGWQFNDLRNTQNSNIPSVGFSIHLPFDELSPSIDYAFLKEPNGVSYMHVFALRLEL